MTDCCSGTEPSNAFPSRHACPANGKEYRQVAAATIKHHLRSPWAWRERSQAYYFCSDPNCDVVYFGHDGSVIERSELRTEVGIKSEADDALVCYCYGVTRADARADPGIRGFVANETKNKRCACESRNPSGKCCLADFPRP